MTRLVVALTTVIILTGTAAGRSLPSQGGSAPGQPPGWSDTLRQTLDLTIAGKHSEVVAIYEQWVARYPNFADGHAMLGAAYESLGREALTSRASDAAMTALKCFETAATHLRRAFDLGGGETPSIAIRSLVDIYGPNRLRRPEQQEAVVREALKKFPAEPRAHGEYIKLLMIKGEKPEAVDSAVRAARTAVPKAAEPGIELAALLHQIGEEFPGAVVAPAMIGEGVSVPRRSRPREPAGQGYPRSPCRSRRLRERVGLRSAQTLHGPVFRWFLNTPERTTRNVTSTPELKLGPTTRLACPARLPTRPFRAADRRSAPADRLRVRPDRARCPRNRR